jgi:hypothetical protein
MTQRSTQSRAVSRCAALRFGVLGVGLTVALLGGCAAQKKTKAQSFPWATVKSTRPVLPCSVTPSPDTTVSDFLPEFELEAPPPPSPVAEIQSMPQRPRVAAALPGPSNPARPEPPQIAPQLTAQEAAAAEQQTNMSLSIAERNIAASQGRSLNPTQSDLASKIRSFVTEAREAAHSGDWTRASNAAKKAQVLSEQLARSL